MQKIKNRFCYSFIFLSFCLLAYIFINTYFEFENNNLNRIIVLGFLFIFIAFLLSYFKIYKKNYIQKQVEKKTNELKNESEHSKGNSNIDSLTQCLDKDYFLSRLDEEVKRAIREKQTISLIILNIDEFKSFNDIYGRNEGDECLKLMANIIVNYCNRPSDLISRFKNDEFYILLPNTNEPEIIANKCLQAVRRLNIPHGNSIASNIVTISIGISKLIPLHKDQKDELISKAKHCLNEAKKAGRNRIF